MSATTQLAGKRAPRPMTDEEWEAMDEDADGELPPPRGTRPKVRRLRLSAGDPEAEATARRATTAGHPRRGPLADAARRAARSHREDGRLRRLRRALVLARRPRCAHARDLRA